ncbi:MAG: SCO family protein [Hyphomicrobiaceae bacterium]
MSNRILLSMFAISSVAIGAVAALHWTPQHWKPQAEPARFTSSAPGARWGKDYLPNLPVVDQDGLTYRFYDDLIKNKKVIINFIFTTCTDICPLTTARMALLQEKLGDQVGRDVQMYSISVDPEHDSPAQLKRYANAFKVRPGWKFLTGKPADIQLIRDKLGERSRIKTEHRHEMLLGNDDIGDWSKDSAYGDLDRVVMNVHALDPKWRQLDAPAIKTSQATQIEISDRPGEVLFTKACASCHTIGNGDKVGPDLLDVAARRPKDWLISFISRPDRMFAKGDPIALALMDKFPNVNMPNLGLSESDAADVLAFIEAQSWAVHAPPAVVRAAGPGLGHLHKH